MDANRLSTEVPWLEMERAVRLSSMHMLPSWEPNNFYNIYPFDIVCDYMSVMFRRQRCDFNSGQVAAFFLESTFSLVRQKTFLQKSCAVAVLQKMNPLLGCLLSGWGAQQAFPGRVYGYSMQQPFYSCCPNVS